MRKLIMTFAFFLSIVPGIRADFNKTDFNEPDFSQPCRVMEDARKVLKKTDKPLTRLQAVMEITTATMAIGGDDLWQMPQFIEKQTKKESDPVAKGLMQLYEATVVADIYNQNQYTPRQITPTATHAVPADMRLWSVDDYDRKVKDLYIAAIAAVEPCQTADLGKLGQVIEIPEESKIFYPYLRDFVMTQGGKLPFCREIADSLCRSYLHEATEGSAEWAMLIGRAAPKDSLLAMALPYIGTAAGQYLLDCAAQLVDSDSKEFLQVVKALKIAIPQTTLDPLAKALKSRLDYLTGPKLQLSAPGVFTTSDSINVALTHSWTKSVGFAVFSDNGNESVKTLMAKKPLKSINIVTADSLYNQKTTLTTAPLKAGNYLLVAILDGQLQYAQRRSFVVSDLLPITLWQTDGCMIVADAVSGKPAKGIAVWLRQTNGKRKSLGKTNAEGRINIPENTLTHRGGAIEIETPSGMVRFAGALEKPYTFQPKDEPVAEIIVERPLFHLADSVKWCAVAFEKNYKEGKSTLQRQKALEVVFYDANRQPIDTLSVTTDEFGRAEGSFHIPSDRLAGRFSISVISDKRTIGTASVMVSDFKLRNFELIDLQIEDLTDTLAVVGQAMRYTGVPVDEAKIAVEIPGKFYTEGSANQNGVFRIPIAKSALDKGNYYIAEVTVTAPTGEAVQDRLSFVNRWRPELIMNALKPINIDSVAALPIFLINSANERIDGALQWNVKTAEGAIIASGEAQVSQTGVDIDFSKVGVGRYLASFITQSDTIALNLDFYSKKQNRIPAEMGWLVSEGKQETANDDVLHWQVALSEPSTVYTASPSAQGIKVASFNLPAGFSNIDIPLSADVQQQIGVAMVRNRKIYTTVVNVTREDNKNKVYLKGESLRDNLTPGAHENWTLELSDADGKPLKGALIAKMYNKAIEALVGSYSKNSLLRRMSTKIWSRGATFNTPDTYNTYMWIEPNVNFKFFYLTDPSFRFTSKFATGIIHRNGMMLTASSTKEMKVECTSDCVMADMVQEESSETEDADAGADAGTAGPLDESDTFRDSETLQALWMPDLVIDASGKCTLKFTMPQAIGAWQFSAAAWTDDCSHAELHKTLVTAKPVMVEPHLPRFMHRGDSITASAAIINATDQNQTIKISVETFNPFSSEIYSQISDSLNLNANTQAIYEFALLAPEGVENIGVRIKATADGFTDGEQSIIPVLADDMMAIEAENFWLTPGNSFTTVIKPTGSGITALQYCANALWEAVKALPGLYQGAPMTATEAAASLFASLTAKDLFNRYPQISNVLRIWSETSSGEALTSALEKNEDLKMFTLQQTPFVGSAQASDQRMARLAATFNRSDIDSNTLTAMQCLKSLQNADGGFRWGRWSNESSYFITMRVLNTLGRLNSSNSLLTDMARKALAFIDASTQKPSAEFAMVHGWWPQIKPTTKEAAKILDESIKSIEKDWKKATTHQKTLYAITLTNSGREATARKIMASVSQFAVETPRGVKFPSLRFQTQYSDLLMAYALTGTDENLRQGILKRILLDTQTTDDLGLADPTALISAIIANGAKWLEIGKGAEITLNGRQITPTQIEAATGAFSITLPVGTEEQILKINCGEASHLAYGSVIQIHHRKIEDFTSTEGDEVKIGRRLLTLRQGAWVETDTFSLGERVKVELTIITDRAMEYVAISSPRSALTEPVEQMPGWVWSGTTGAYRAVANAKTDLYINYLPKGVNVFSYEITASQCGQVVLPPATIQSQYAPGFSANSAPQIFHISK